MSTILIKNAQIVNRGKIFNSDILVKNGRIEKIDSSIDQSADREIDATGKHITSGVIDEHTHIGASRGINEGTQASSAEVSIGLRAMKAA